MSTRTFSPEQQRAIDSDAGAILAIAGPGSGKTTTLVGRILRLVSPCKWDNNGDGDCMHHPNGCPRPVPLSKVVVITFTNAAAKELQHRIVAELGEGARFGFIGTLHGFALRELQRHGALLGYGERITILDEEQAEELMSETAKELGSKAKLKELWRIRQEWQPGQKGTTPAELVVVAYLRKLRAASAVDFDSLLADFLELLRVWPGSYSKACSGDPDGLAWAHLFVDEYQDSGATDAAIYAALPVANRFFVGDPDQAIYGFRGGKVSNILELAESGVWEVHTMQDNYRCAPAICAAANNLIAHNTGRLDKRTVAVCEEPGQVFIRPNMGSHEQERTTVLANVQKIMGQGTPAMEIAILARSNAVVADYVTSAEAMGIPVRKKAAPKMPKDWTAARAAVELLNTPFSTLAARQWLRAKHGPEVAADIVKKAALAQIDLWRMVQEPVLKVPAADYLGEAMARMGISMESIELVLAKADELPTFDLAALAFTLARDLEHTSELGEGVTITTHHGAKGREWHTVYMVACEQEVMPGESKSRDTEEERRIAFVGITRAKRRLVMCAANKRPVTWGRRQVMPSTPSQFLAEVEA